MQYFMTMLKFAFFFYTPIGGNKNWLYKVCIKLCFNYITAIFFLEYSKKGRFVGLTYQQKIWKINVMHVSIFMPKVIRFMLK